MTDAAQPLGHTNQQSGTLPGQGLRFGTNTETSSLATNPPYVPKTAPIPLPAPPQISSAIEAEAHASPKPPFETVTKFMGPKTNLQPSPKADEELQALDDNATLQTEKVSALQLQQCPSQPTSVLPRASIEYSSHAPLTSSGCATTPASSQSTVPTTAKTQRDINAHPLG